MTTITGTCQICSRPIGFKAGIIAHHGYRRPGEGWQTASCYGARHVPFEISRDRLGDYIAHVLETEHAKLSARVAELAANEAGLVVAFTFKTRLTSIDRATTTLLVSAANYNELKAAHPSPFLTYSSAHSFDSLRKLELQRQTSNLKMLKAELFDARKRFAGWRPAA